jgi:putative membrane protein
MFPRYEKTHGCRRRPHSLGDDWQRYLLSQASEYPEENMRYVSVLAVVVTVLALIVVSPAQQNSSDQTMPTGKAFIDKAAEINLGEVELGKLAEQKGNNAAVKDFGKRMIQDHSQAEQELDQLAKREGVTLPSQPGPEAASLQQQLSSVSGEQFDQIYVQHMLAGHKGAVATFENEIEHGRNPAIKAYAEKVLPVIQDHIRIAEDLAGKMGMAGKEGLTQPGKAIAAPAIPK